MRASAILLCAVALTGCSHDQPSSGGSDAGAPLTCPAADKPLGTSALQTNVFRRPDHVQVGQTVEFLVPANTASITIVEQAVSAPDSITLSTPGQQLTVSNTAVPLIVKDPSGNTLYDDNQALPADISTLPVFFASDSPDTGTLTIPNTTAGLALLGAGGLPDGTWSFIVSDFAYECTSPAASPLRSGVSCESGTDQSLYDVTVITKPGVGGAIQPSGTLDVAIYFATTVAGGAAGAAPLDADAANAGTDPDLNRMVTALGQLFSQAGITLGKVSYRLLPPDVLATYATGVNVDQAGACAPLAQLLKLADPGNTLNIFFVSRFEASGLQTGNTVVGIDGTIPGPSTIGGTVASGAAVATIDLRFASGTPPCADVSLNLQCGADRTAYIIAHEAGHFLGLYHVTESDGLFFDPLADTATCVCSVCASTATNRAHCANASPPPAAGAEHLMTFDECTQGQTECGGGANLMFWRLSSGSLGQLSDQQKSVIRANPLVQAVP
jgi:hypothetical protein